MTFERVPRTKQGITTAMSAEKSRFDERDRAEALVPHTAGALGKSDSTSQPPHARVRSSGRAVKKIYHLLRVILVLATVGFYFYTQPDNYVTRPIKKVIFNVQEWRHHPYTLPEFYSLCSRDAHGIYTSEAGKEWAQCVTVQNGTIVDVGDLGQ